MSKFNGVKAHVLPSLAEATIHQILESPKFAPESLRSAEKVAEFWWGKVQPFLWSLKHYTVCLQNSCAL